MINNENLFIIINNKGQNEWIHFGLLTTNERRFAMAKLNLPSQEYLNNILSYDPDTGKLYWKYRADRNKTWNVRYANKETGCVVFKNRELYTKYIVLTLDSKVYLAHRIIIKMLYNIEPECVDHINGIGTDNSIKNIKPTTLKANQRNKKLHSNNKSGVSGVFYDKSRNRWVAVNPDTHTVKRFKSKNHAIEHRSLYVKEAGNYTERHGR